MENPRLLQVNGDLYIIYNYREYVVVVIFWDYSMFYNCPNLIFTNNQALGTTL